MSDFITERLSTAHRTRGFRCGEPSLDSFLVQHALVNQRNNRSVTYVLPARSDDECVQGYYTLAMSHVSLETIPLDEAIKQGPRYFRPTLLLARLAVAKSHQRQGRGRDLLRDALVRFAAGAEAYGACALEVDALTARAASFYENLGFHRFLDAPLHMFIPTQTVLKALGRGAE